jgi:hypothetical protein
MSHIVPGPNTSLARLDPPPPEVVRAMLDGRRGRPRDHVYDLGSGDGRIVIERRAAELTASA